METYKEYLFNKSENTKKTYLKAVSQFEKYLEENNCKVICEPEIQKYVDTLKEKNAPSTIKLKVSVINSYLDYKKIKIAIYKIRVPKVNRDLSPKIISNEKMAIIESKITNKQYRVIFCMLKTLGMRRSEVFNLRHIDINLNNLTIEIKNSKGNKGRILPITKDIEQAIIIFKEVNKSYDRYFNIRNLELINQYFKRIDPDISPHMFRHTCITHLIKVKKLDLVTVQAITGHASLETLKIYYKPTLEDIREHLD